jgi:hypothetical protein
VSCAEQAVAAEPQLLPLALEKAVAERAGSQTWQGLPGASAPASTQTPAITQPLQVLSQVSVATLHTALVPHWLTGAEQLSEASSQVETPLHATPSSHLRGLPVQEPARQTSSIVQKSWSSHGASSLFDQARASRAGSQIRQAFSGWTASAATHSPPMKQPGQLASHAPASASQSETGGQLPSAAQPSSLATPTALSSAPRFEGAMSWPSLAGPEATLGPAGAVAALGAGWLALVTCGG